MAVSDATGRIQEIIDVAARVAEEIQADAQAAATTYLEDRRRAADQLVGQQAEVLTTLAKDLSDHAASLRHQSEEIVSSLEGAVARLRSAPATAGVEPPPAPVEEATGAGEGITTPGPAAAPPPAPAPAPEAAPPLPSAPDAALLRATQLAVAGTDRAEIEAALRRDFGVEEPAAIVDRILGSEGRD